MYIDAGECFTGNYITREIHTKLHPGLEWCIFHILTCEDIVDFTDIEFIILLKMTLKVVGVSSKKKNTS